MKARIWLRRLACAAIAAWSLLLAFPACNTPFIPLPPPGDPTFTPVEVADGMGGMRTVWQASAGANSSMAEAKISLFNADAGSGVIVRAQPDGSYVAGPFEGQEGDRMQIQYESKDRRPSPGICRVLTRGLSQTACP